MANLTRTEYAAMSTDELLRRMKRAEDRADRAMTTEAALTDMFACQEICAVLSDRGENPYDGDADDFSPDSRDINHDAGWSL